MSKLCHASRLCITLLTLGINFVGGLLTFVYLTRIGVLFRTSDSQWLEKLFFLGVISLAIVGEIGHGFILSAVYKSYHHLAAGKNKKIFPSIQLRAANLPAIVSAGSLLLWIFSAVTFGGIVWKLAPSSFCLYTFGQIFLSVGIVAGGTTSILIYFIIERYWQPYLPVFFPDGDMSRIPSLRPSIFQRLFVLFLLGIMPPIVMAGLSYDLVSKRISQEVTLDLLSNLRAIYLFVLGVSFLVAIFLAFSVGMSLIRFSKELLLAMKKVAQGDLETSLLVTTSDEMGKISQGFNTMLEGVKQEKFVRRLFERYVGAEVATHLIEEKETIVPELVEATILFVDIRKFTSLTESLPPTELMRLLNRFLSEMSEAVVENHGLINKFIGDSIMAIYGTKLNESQNAADEALATAFLMLSRLEIINHIHEREGLPTLKIGIGIASGKILAGTLGQGERVEYTFIGDAVNLASRLEGMTKKYHTPVLLDFATVKLLSVQSCYEVGKVLIRGKEEPVQVFSPSPLVNQAVLDSSKELSQSFSPYQSFKKMPETSMGNKIFRKIQKRFSHEEKS